MNLASPAREIDVLLVDDNPAQALLVRTALADIPRLNLVHVAENGPEALRYLRREDEFRAADLPGLILLDINMPGMNGLEVLDEIRATPGLRQIPVVMMTTSDHQDDIVDSYERGANSYIMKPMQFDQMVMVFENLANYWCATAELPRV